MNFAPNPQSAIRNPQLSECPFDRAAVVALTAEFSTPDRIRTEPAICAVAVHAAAGILKQLERSRRLARQLARTTELARLHEQRAAVRREAARHRLNCPRLQNPFAGLEWKP